MACGLYNRTRLVRYLPSPQVLMDHVARCGARARPAAGSSGSDEARVALSDTRLQTQSAGPFGSQDRRLQLPRAVGFEGLAEPKRPGHTMVPDGPCPLSGGERNDLILAQLVGDVFDKEDSPRSVCEGQADDSSVEWAVQSCPDALKKDFQSMFPEAPSSEMMVITIAQKTKNDMKSWSPEVEQEREQMLDKFIEGATEMCSALQRDGFWADFIDPSSGLAFFGSYTNNLLFETDERYRHLGFHIEDLGCCRVIGHSAWGTQVFVGTLVTSAPPSSTVMKNLLST